MSGSDPARYVHKPMLLTSVVKYDKSVTKSENILSNIIVGIFLKPLHSRVC